MDKKQKIQDNEYDYPYHYIPQYYGNYFSQTQYWPWGFRYLGGIKIVLDQLKTLEFNSLLDLGCGDGRFLYELKSVYPDSELLGVDYSSKAIHLAEVMNPDIKFLNKNILSDKIEEKFDVVTSIEVLEHIPVKSLSDFVKESASLVKDGGYFIITVPHSNASLQEKHYQHFDSTKLLDCLDALFREITFIPFDPKSRVVGYFYKFLGGKGNTYVITQKKLNKWFFDLYTQKYLYAKSEKNCRRIAAICKK